MIPNRFEPLRPIKAEHILKPAVLAIIALRAASKSSCTSLYTAVRQQHAARSAGARWSFKRRS